MNDTLESTSIEKIQYIGNTGDMIMENIMRNARGFETFVTLLNTTTWQSHRELTEVFIQKVARKEYTELLSKNENPELNELRACAIDMISECAFNALRECTQNLSRWQQIKSQFLVTCILAKDLPVQDQDRILAKEMGVSYEVWQQMLGFFSHNMGFINLLQLQDTSLERAIACGNEWFVLIAPEWNYEQISSLWTLPGVEIIHQSDNENDSLLFINDEVFRRYDHILRLKENESIIRSTVHDRFGNLYVYKRFFGGNKEE